MMLRGMGFANDTSIYLASGKIYGAERHLVPLLKMFPHLHTKESLSTQDELAPFVVNSCPRSCTMFKLVFCSSGPGDMEINFNLSKHNTSAKKSYDCLCSPKAQVYQPMCDFLKTIFVVLSVTLFGLPLFPVCAVSSCSFFTISAIKILHK